jgi:hypothetical protein
MFDHAPCRDSLEGASVLDAVPRLTVVDASTTAQRRAMGSEEGRALDIAQAEVPA